MSIDEFIRCGLTWSYDLRKIDKQEPVEDKLASGELYPVTVEIQHDHATTVRYLEMNIWIYHGGFDPIRLDFKRNYDLKKQDLASELLFDASPYSDLLIILSDIKYLDDVQKSYYVLRSNVPFSIDLKSLSGPIRGFRNEKEIRVKLLLESYLLNGLPARGVLLKCMFKILDDIIKSKKIEIDGVKIDLPDNELSAFAGLVQIDIISKTMMYLEDLYIILCSLLNNEGDYYEWLDKKNPDIGDRIRDFKSIPNRTDSEWAKMLSYVDPLALNIDYSSQLLVKKIMDSNIHEFKMALDHFDNFAKSHIDASRRYKHAGLPIRFGYKDGESNSLTSLNFDFYTIIFAGQDPLRESLPLPFSRKAIESYKKVVKTIQMFITHLVQNKLRCIGTVTGGLLPESYFTSRFSLTSDEIEKYNIIKLQYDRRNAIKALDDKFSLPFDKNVIDKMVWYVELEKNMRLWDKMAQEAESSPLPLL